MAGQQRQTDGFHVQIVFRDDYGNRMTVARRHQGVHCLGDRPVGGHPAHEIDRFIEGALLERSDHAGDAFAEGVEHGFNRHALLLQMDEVALGEDAAAGGDAGRRPLEGQGQGIEIFDPDAEAVGLLLQKPARSGGTERVRSHLPRLVQPIIQFDHQRALPADLHYRPSVRMQVKKSGRDGQGTAVFGPLEGRRDHGLPGTRYADGRDRHAATIPPDVGNQ